MQKTVRKFTLKTHKRHNKKYLKLLHSSFRCCVWSFMEIENGISNCSRCSGMGVYFNVIFGKKTIIEGNKICECIGKH